MEQFTLTHRGLVRENNEDAAGVSDFTWSRDGSFQQATIGVVCDGVGGLESGEIASHEALNTVATETKACMERIAGSIDLTSILTDSISKANQNVLGLAAKAQKPMGTTIVAALVLDDSFAVGWLGDSRAYLITSETITQLTEDHTAIERMVKAGIVTPAEARTHPNRHELDRALGMKPDMEPDVVVGTLLEGSTLLLCTDGITDLLDETAIYTLYRENLTIERFGQALIELALDQGGSDNIGIGILRKS